MGGRFFMALLIILTKWAKFTKLYKILKILKFTKPLITIGTMAFSAFVYAFLLGPWFSVGFVLMLFIHEMGHVLAMKIKGMQVSAPVFIPMLGAVIFAPKFQSKHDEAFIGYAGPLVGSTAALALYGVWWLLPHPSDLILLISYTAAFINLFNLIPIKPLDGGRTTQIVGEWFKYVGLACLLIFTLYIGEPALLLLWIIIIDDVNFEPWLKFYFGVACQISMMALMFLGYSGQVWWVCGIDIFLATLINFLIFGAAIDKEALTEEVHETITLKIRIKWFVFYLALVAGLLFLMWSQIPYLPEQIK